MRTSFAPQCPADPLFLTQAQQASRMACDLEDTGDSCVIDFKLGFFFDGTNNNLIRDQPIRSHSNVARLYDVYEVDPERPEIQRRYIAGAGTPFFDEIGDLGRGLQQKAGLAAGWGGEARICWALLKFLDNLHYYFDKQDFSYTLGQADRDTVRRMAHDINIPAMQLRLATADETEMLRQIGMLQSLQTLTATALNQPNHLGRRMLLQHRRELLAQKVRQWTAARPKPRLRRIHLSVFGFSRGAAEARVFCQWLRDACDGGGKGGQLSLCGIPVQLDFLGIFDTVASVGLANSAKVSDGHGGYASEADLRIAPWVRRCVHLVAAHEVRGSFPLDTAYGADGEEVVYPGVHSDVGGGYAPNEQGKGYATPPAPGSNDDAAKLSQIPLCHMYREAVAAGVPFNVARRNLPQRAKDAFKVDSGLIAAFNGYVEATRAINNGSTPELMRAHYGLYLRWRRLRLDDSTPHGMAHQPFIARARAFKAQDETDLLSANRELYEEWQALLKEESDPAYQQGLYLSLLLRRTLVGPLAARDGFKEMVWGDKMRNWRELRPYWDNTAPLDARIVRLHDDYSHDSRAWFKPFGAASEQAWERDFQEKMRKLDAQHKRYEQWVHDTEPQLKQMREAAKIGNGFGASQGWLYSLPPMPPPVTGEDLEDLLSWRANGGKTRTERDGRETYSIFGFLRLRTLYVENPSLIRQGMNAANRAAKDIERSAKDAVGEAARKAAQSATDHALDAGKDFILDQAKKLVPSHLPKIY